MLYSGMDHSRKTQIKFFAFLVLIILILQLHEGRAQNLQITISVSEGETRNYVITQFSTRGKDNTEFSDPDSGEIYSYGLGDTWVVTITNTTVADRPLCPRNCPLVPDSITLNLSINNK